jgi:hypothetical protein
MNSEDIKETVQDLIDRLLYLSEADKSKFMSGLNTLFSKYETNMEVINGVRIYNINKK